MGEAYLHNHGGAALTALTVRTPPSKVIYYYNDPIDMSGSVIVAKIGSTELILSPGMYTYSPLIAASGDTQITVSFTFGRRTLTAAIPITVGTFDPVFARNTWEAIAAAAALGVGKDFWSVGDEKNEVINYEERTFRILDFDHAGLSSDDERYNDSSYNGGTNKAHIMLQSVEPWGNAVMGSWGVGGKGTLMGSGTDYSRLPEAYDMFPSSLREAIRLVSIKRAPQALSYPYRLYLLAVSEMFPVTAQNAYQYDVDDGEPAFYTQCAFYENKGTLIPGDNWPEDYDGEWLISTKRGSNSDRYFHHTYVNASDQVVNEAIDGVNRPEALNDYYPVFNI